MIIHKCLSELTRPVERHDSIENAVFIKLKGTRLLSPGFHCNLTGSALIPNVAQDELEWFKFTAVAQKINKMPQTFNNLPVEHFYLGKPLSVIEFMKEHVKAAKLFPINGMTYNDNSDFYSISLASKFPQMRVGNIQLHKGNTYGARALAVLNKNMES